MLKVSLLVTIYNVKILDLTGKQKSTSFLRKQGYLTYR